MLSIPTDLANIFIYFSSLSAVENLVYNRFMIPRYFDELLRVSITSSYAISSSEIESLILKGKQISTDLLGLICNLLAAHHFFSRYGSDMHDCLGREIDLSVSIN